MDNTVELEVRHIIGRISRVPSVDQLALEDDLFEKLGIDSMQRIEILIEIEKKFGIAVPDEEAQTLKRLSDFVDVVAKFKTNEKV